MKDLSLHILDLAQNSLKANCTELEILVNEDLKKDLFEIIIKDDGTGMNENFLKIADDPFTTTRKTRSVGLGLSLTKAAALRCEGKFNIKSKKGKGTEIFFSFKYSHIDRAPLGNIGETIVSLINNRPEIEIRYSHIYNENKFNFNTRDIKKLLDEVDINNVDILLWIKDYINENINELKLSCKYR